MSNIESILGSRKDILLEGYQNLDDSGNFTSQWFDSAGITHVRVAANMNSMNDRTAVASLTITEASFNGTFDDSNRVIIRNQSISVGGSISLTYADLDITARFFRLTMNGTSVNADSAFFALIRGL